MPLISWLLVLLLKVILFCHESEPAVTAFGSLKPPNPSFAKEGDSITLRWNYTLDGSIGFAKFSNLTDGVRDFIATKFGTGNVTVVGDFQERFRADISDTLAQLKILTVQKSDRGNYEIEIVTTKNLNLIDAVKLIVQYPADITYISGNQTVNENDVVILNCSAGGEPNPNITWTRVSNNSTVDFTFTITGKQDEGRYRCTAHNGIGDVAFSDAFIAVQSYHPININLTTDLSGNRVLVNTTFNITCSAQANPPAKYRFYRDQENFINDTTDSDVSVITTLVSERVKQVNYGCTPFNDFGDGKTEVITLTVLFPPEIDYATSNFEVVEGNGAILFCNATGNPQPNVTWTKQGNNSILSTSETLNLTKLMRVDDGSVYKCTVTNEVGSARAFTAITVLVPPMSTIHSCPSEVTEGDNVTLYCNATGNPPPKVAWIRSGEVLVKDSAYIIPAIDRNQKGIYECMAWNGIGNNFTTNCNVDVQYLPTATIMTTLPSNTTVLRDAAVSLKCTTDANPDTHIYHFFLNSNLIGNSSSGVFNLTVKEDGVYTCVPINNIGTGDNATVSINAVAAPAAEVIPQNIAVNEGGNITLTCNVSGDPLPRIHWTKLGGSEVLSNTSFVTIVNVSRARTSDHTIQYRCTASNGVGTPATDIARVTVHYAPGVTTLTTVPSNTTLLRDSNISLNCETDASPQPEYYFFFNGNSIGNSSSGVVNVTVEEDGVYTCVPINTVGRGNNDTVRITAVVAPSVEISNTTANVVEGNNLTLTCNGSGTPEPSLTWTKLDISEALSNTSSLTIVNVSRPGTPNNLIKYQCTARNGVGTPATATATINVYYPPLVTIEPAYQEVYVGQRAKFVCHANGNPTPEIEWSPRDGNKNVLNFEAVTLSDEDWYSCSADNRVGSAVTVSAYLKVIDRENEDEEVNGAMKLTNVAFHDDLKILSSERAQNLIITVKNAVRGVFQNDNTYNDTRVIRFEKGSVNVFYTIIFNKIVSINDTIAVLVNAAENGTLGNLTVEPGSIKAIRTVVTVTTTATSTSKVTTGATTPLDGDDGGIGQWIIIVAVVGGVAVVAIVVGVVAYCVHKKRKCRKKDTKVQEQALASGKDSEDITYAQHNNGCADSGPRSTEMTEMNQNQEASSPAGGQHVKQNEEEQSQACQGAV